MFLAYFLSDATLQYPLFPDVVVHLQIHSYYCWLNVTTLHTLAPKPSLEHWQRLLQHLVLQPQPRVRRLILSWMLAIFSAESQTIFIIPESAITFHPDLWMLLGLTTCLSAWIQRWMTQSVLNQCSFKAPADGGISSKGTLAHLLCIEAKAFIQDRKLPILRTISQIQERETD